MTTKAVPGTVADQRGTTMTTRRATVMLVAASLSLVTSGTGCKDCNPTNTAPDAGASTGTGPQPPADSGPPPTDAGVMVSPVSPATADQVCACLTPSASAEWHDQGTLLQGTVLANQVAPCAAQVPPGSSTVRSFSLGGMTTSSGHAITGVTVDHGQLHGTDATTGAQLAAADWSGVQTMADLDCIADSPATVPLRARITGVLPYDRAPTSLPPRPGLTGTAYLYSVELFEPRTNNWVGACKEPGDMAIPSGEVWTKQGARGASTTKFTFACVQAVIAKCYTWGYVPWAPATGVTDPSGLHQACTRMGRADYCGTGESNTVDHNNIDEWDRFGIALRADAGTSLEAAWGPDGAVCLDHYRLPSSHPRCAPHTSTPCRPTPDPCARTGAATAGAVTCDGTPDAGVP